MTHLFKAFPSTAPGFNIASVRSLNLHHAHVHLLSPQCLLRGARPRNVATVAAVFSRPAILPRVGTTTYA